MLCWAGRLQRRRRPMYAYVRRRARRPNEQSRAKTGERSRERPSRPLLAQKLARTSLARHQPQNLNEVTAHHARLHCSFLHHMSHPERLRYEQSAKTGAVARKIRTFEAGLTSPTTRGARRFPLSISRTAAALPFWSALTCVEAPSSADCTGRSGAAPPRLFCPSPGAAPSSASSGADRVSELRRRTAHAGTADHSGQLCN